MIVTSKYKKCCVFAFSLCLSVYVSPVCVSVSPSACLSFLCLHSANSAPDDSMTPETVLPMGSRVKGWSGGVLRAGLCSLPPSDLDRAKGQAPSMTWSLAPVRRSPPGPGAEEGTEKRTTGQKGRRTSQVRNDQSCLLLWCLICRNMALNGRPILVKMFYRLKNSLPQAGSQDYTISGRRAGALNDAFQTASQGGGCRETPPDAGLRPQELTLRPHLAWVWLRL